MDVIQAFQQKIQNVVAQMGTALTEQQVKILKRFTNNFVLALDADTAGNAATLRGIEIARGSLDREAVPVPTARGLIRFENRLDANIRIAEMPPGKDPDDILKEEPDVWQQIIHQALPVVDFYFKTVSERLDLDSAKDKSTAVDSLLPVLRDINNKVEQQHYVQKLARLVRIDERTLLAELNRKPNPGRKKTVSVPASVVSYKSSSPSSIPVTEIVFETNLEEFCLSLVLAHPSALATANHALEQTNISGLAVNDFNHGENRDIFRAIQLWTASAEPTFEKLAQLVDNSLTGKLTRLMNTWQESPPTPPERIYKELVSAILRLRLQIFAEQIKHLSFLQQEAMETSDHHGAREYTEMVETCRLQRKKLEQTRDALSISGQRRAEVIY
jgi:DNA primase